MSSSTLNISDTHVGFLNKNVGNIGICSTSVGVASDLKICTKRPYRLKVIVQQACDKSTQILVTLLNEIVTNSVLFNRQV